MSLMDVKYHFFLILSFPFLQLQKDLVDILEGFRKNNLDLATHVTVVARRRRVLHSACIALHKSYFEWRKIPDIEFVGELAEDYGGPRREFFR